MDRTEVSFSCDAALWKQFLGVCKDKGLEPGALLSEVVGTKVRAFEREKSRGIATKSELWMKRLRGSVETALAQSHDWAGVRLAMDRYGIAYHPSGGGLIIIDSSTGEVLCNASDVGPSYGDLVRKFGAGYPGHPKPWLAEEALAKARQSA
jgi:hypothetical protein